MLVLSGLMTSLSLLLLTTGVGCGGGAHSGASLATGEDASGGAGTSTWREGRGDPHCRAQSTPVHQAPGTARSHREVATWLTPPAARPGNDTAASTPTPPADAVHTVPAKQVLLDRTAIAALRLRDQEIPGAWHSVVPDLRSGTTGTTRYDATAVRTSIEDRVAYLNEAVVSGRYVEGEPGAADEVKARSASAEVLQGGGTLHLTSDELTIWCGPTELGLLSAARDLAFDRNRCSEVHAAELIRVLATSSDGWRFVDAGYADGWIRSDDLTPPLTPKEAMAWEEPSEIAVILDDNVRASAGPVLRMGTRLPVVEAHHDGLDPGTWSATVQVPSRAGLREAELVVDRRVHLGDLTLSRESALTVAFPRLGDPYGWGGFQGGRDCSRFLLDLFATMGVRLGRNSAIQGRQGAKTIELGGLEDSQKLALIHEAANQGLVLLWMKGHIMLYLGAFPDETGTIRDYAISSISEYVVPCAADQDNTYRLDRVEVTTLDLGLNSQRKSFIQRLESATLFGVTP